MLGEEGLGGGDLVGQLPFVGELGLGRERVVAAVHRLVPVALLPDVGLRAAFLRAGELGLDLALAAERGEDGREHLDLAVAGEEDRAGARRCGVLVALRGAVAAANEALGLGEGEGLVGHCVLRCVGVGWCVRPRLCSAPVRPACLLLARRVPCCPASFAPSLSAPAVQARCRAARALARPSLPPPCERRASGSGSPPPRAPRPLRAACQRPGCLACEQARFLPRSVFCGYM